MFVIFQAVQGVNLCHNRRDRKLNITCFLSAMTDSVVWTFQTLKATFLIAVTPSGQNWPPLYQFQFIGPGSVPVSVRHSKLCDTGSWWFLTRTGDSVRGPVVCVCVQIKCYY